MQDYEALRQRHAAQARELMPEYIARLSWPRERIEQEQTAGLRRMIALAREGSSWHRARLALVDVDSLTLADVSSLPVMTKDDLMSHWDEIVTDSRLNLDLANRHLEAITSDAYLLDMYHVVASGGSSGVRGVFAWSWDAWAIAFCAGMRWGARRAALSPATPGSQPVSASVAAAAPTHMTAVLGQTFADPTAVNHRFPVTMPLADIVAGLNAVQPTRLMGYATALNELAREALEGRLRIAPVSIMSTAEPLLPEMRATIEAAWNAPVGSLWGTSEGCTTGAPCLTGSGMHLSEDMLIVELVGSNGVATRDGEKSDKIFLTNLINPALPLIRYEITDEVRVITEPCPCGSHFKRVDDIQGRVDDMFRYDGGVSIHPHVFRSPLSRDREIIEYQVRQTPRGADVMIRASGDVDEDALRTQIASHVERAGLSNPEITLRTVPSIGRTSAGKLRRFVPI